MCLSDARLDGKVVIVTGANTGIGKETALDLVNRGAKVYMACRSMARGNAAAADIKKLSKTGDDRVVVRELNLGSLASVRAFAKKFKSEESKLDILINNAGTMMNPLSATEDGFEMQVGVNHLGHFLLTVLLVEPLKAAAPSRVVAVSSLGHIFADALGLDQFMYDQYTEESYGRIGSYGRSKMYNILFAKELARRLKGTGVTTYSLHPGSIITELQRNVIPFEALNRAVGYLSWPFFKEVIYGAQTTICAAVDPALANDSGKYYSDCAEKAPDCRVCEDLDSDAEKLWKVSLEAVKVTAEETDKTML
ncbi:hypothetical protein CAPTEDRAFT_188568 [Capitella teleta]|uniref:Retinol dehydrogenase 12 n=1 Tax=Capitella teleta TaxID=283909 RepID=R7UQ46_CAPTE|nr:hypothetical protein CAPTEDRAFT_188568 [Capitella teleta]|eukprot:ELU06042.1 hypothetical protein CAPTEDRAFT_188568 [Capitella teleta]